MRPAGLLWVGVVVVLMGGAVLAFGSADWATQLGTALGLAGIALIVWGWASQRRAG